MVAGQGGCSSAIPAQSRCCASCFEGRHEDEIRAWAQEIVDVQ